MSLSDKDLYSAAFDALMTADPGLKCEQTTALRAAWSRRSVIRTDAGSVQRIADPGRPNTPQLVPFSELSRRGVGTPRGRIALAHALAHIEFNAINLALDAVYRFREMPDAYYDDWLLVASEEAAHFTLLCEYLVFHNAAYGDLPAHGGLWDVAHRTDGDVLVRMALVPRVLEARGLDVTPAIIKRLERVGDERLVTVLERIYRDEIGHVRIGNYWFESLCKQRELNPPAAFRQLLSEYQDGPLRGPFNIAARVEAGFTAAELADLETLADQPG